MAYFLAAPAAHAGVVNANNAGGDAYNNPTGINQGQAIGASGWYYNNVRNNATIGIDSSHPRNSNGSVAFNAPNNGKADVEYLPGAVSVGGNYGSTQSLGLFSDLVSMSYDLYRDGSSQATSHLHPSLRVLLDRDGNLATTNDRGGLVFERVYNGVPTSADQWTSDIVNGSSFVWNFGLGLGNEYESPPAPTSNWPPPTCRSRQAWACSPSAPSAWPRAAAGIAPADSGRYPAARARPASIDACSSIRRTSSANGMGRANSQPCPYCTPCRRR